MSNWTSLHFLTFLPNTSFSDPKTRDGKLWYSALKTIITYQGWEELMWGEREDNSGADLFLRMVFTSSRLPSIQLTVCSYKTGKRSSIWQTF